MRVVIAPDKFKGSLTAPQAAEAIARGVRGACPEAACDLVPMADGGEGTVAALVSATGGSIRRVTVTDPLGHPIEAEFGILGDGRTAVIEMASASGLVLVPPEQRDPRWTSTRGTGDLLLAAIGAGASRVIVGIGGSATNDGGAGLAQALGFRLLDDNGRDLEPGGGFLDWLRRIDPSGRHPDLNAVRIDVACDVDNPLCGPRGATAVYGPQKGATGPMIAQLDANLRHLARVIEHDLGVAVAELPGAGAAGGLGAGLVAFAGGRLRPGVELVIEAVGLEQRLSGADLCLTAEGAIDHQTAHGKTPVGVSRRAKSLGVPALALAGTLGEGAGAVLNEGINAYFSICPRPISMDAAIERAGELLAAAAEQAVRAFLAGRLHPERSR